MRKAPVECPLLLECNFLGRVLWMSNRTRLALRKTAEVWEAIVRGNPLVGSNPEIEVSPLRFWTVWESRDSVLIAIQVVEGAPRETKDLLRLQRRLTFHFFRLLGLERLLFARAQVRPGRGGPNAAPPILMDPPRLGLPVHTRLRHA